MALLSGATERKRSAAVVAAAFVLSLATYLVVAAVPAMAVANCNYNAGNDTLTVTMVADDRIVLAIDDGTFIGGGNNRIVVSSNGADFVNCDGALADSSTDFINVTGSDAGSETVTFAQTDDDGGPQDDFVWTAGTPNGDVNITVNLGNGTTDAVVFQYAQLVVSNNDSIADSGGDNLSTGTAPAGNFVDQDDNEEFDVLLANAENMTVNHGNGNGTIFSDPGVDDDFNDSDANTVVSTFGMTINGNGGDDEFEAGSGNDVFNGGPGDDEIDYGDLGGTGQVVSLETGTSTGVGGTDTMVDVQDVQGSQGPDTITGNSLDNDLFGDNGADIIVAGAGNDGSAADAVGIDLQVHGGGGADTITPGQGNDANVNGGLNDDRVIMEATPDGTDGINGDAGNDIIDYGLRTTVTIINPTGTSGVDFNNDGDSNDGGEESDALANFEGYITGSANDRLSGTGTNESFRGGLGDDLIAGGGGFDYSDYATCAAGVTADMVAGTVTGCSVDTIGNVEGIAGSPFDDTFIDLIEQNNDYLGGDGNDTFNQNPQSTDADGLNDDSDLLQGGNGADGTNYDARTEDITVDNGGTFVCGGFPITCTGAGDFDDGAPNEADMVTGTENFTSGAGDDTFTSPAGSTADATVNVGDGDNTVTTAAGNDTITAGNGFDTISSGAGADIVNVDGGGSAATLGDGDDTFTSGDGGDAVSGGLGNDGITTGGGNDVLNGDAGVDVLTGGDGNDVSNGGDDGDTLVGGAGDDTENGDNGNDQFTSNGTGPDGADVINGGQGGDTYDASERTGSQNLSNSRTFCPGDDGEFGEGDSLCFVENINGGSGNDFIVGDNATNILRGFLGGDNIQGLKSRDLVQGMGGDDRISGGQGPDDLRGGPGHDNVAGGPGADTCTSAEVAKSC